MEPPTITRRTAARGETGLGPPYAYRDGVPIALTGEIAWLAVPAELPG